MPPTKATKAAITTPKVQRSSATKSKLIASKPTTSKVSNKAMEDLKKTKPTTAPVRSSPRSTPQSTQKPKVSAAPTNVTRSAKKPSWKRRPLPAHSGVPVPEKMKQLFKAQLNDSL